MLFRSVSQSRYERRFQGRSEFGPRALGNRSIIADPRRTDMKDILNSRVKFRESFRPFTPSVLAEKASDFFELPFLFPSHDRSDGVSTIGSSAILNEVSSTIGIPVRL